MVASKCRPLNSGGCFRRMYAKAYQTQSNTAFATHPFHPYNMPVYPGALRIADNLPGTAKQTSPGVLARSGIAGLLVISTLPTS